MSDGRLVLPGEEVAVGEEFEAGEGTYEDGGKVYAAQPGWLDLDTTHRVARVRSRNPVANPRNGDLVYGIVEEIRPSMVEARIAMIHGRDRQVAGELSASLHVSKISNAYVEDPRDTMRLGDIIRARVIQVDPSLQITTAEQNLGVVVALCTVCRRPMEKTPGGQVRCPRCERTDRRKLTTDYGAPELRAPIAIVPEPGGPRQPRPEHGRGPPRRGGRREGGGRGGRGPPRRDRRR